MPRKPGEWWCNSKSGAIVGWLIIIAAVLTLGGCTVAVLRSLTPLPLWAAAAISLPGGVAFFYWFVKTHETNGFDGPLVPIDPTADQCKSRGGPDAA